jgi:hypothetical protein
MLINNMDHHGNFIVLELIWIDQEVLQRLLTAGDVLFSVIHCEFVL